jgi:hypothetical protein
MHGLLVPNAEGLTSSVMRTALTREALQLL